MSVPTVAIRFQGMQRVQVLTSQSDAASQDRSRNWSPLVRQSGRVLLGSLGSVLIVACAPTAAPPTPTAPVIAVTSTPIVANASPTPPPVSASPTVDPSARTAVVRRGTIDATVTLDGHVVARDELSIMPSSTMHSARLLVHQG